MADNLPASCAIEKFTAADLTSLREELTQSGLDSRQTAELIGVFLTVRGYGVSSHAACGAASRIESVGCSLQSMQEELEKVALVM
jgi:hypothetical protein